LGLQPLYDPLKRLWDYIIIQPSYIIFKRGNVILAKNGETGEIEFSGTDAATVIQSAIDALGTQGGKIFIKAGTYECKSSITLKQNLILEGEAPAHPWFFEGVTCLKFIEPIDGLTITLPEVRPSLQVKHLQIRGAGRDYDICGVKLTKLDMSRFEDVWIDGFKYGVYLDDCDSLLFENCHIINCYYGIYMTNTIETWITRSNIAGCDSGGVLVDKGYSNWITFNEFIGGGYSTTLQNQDAPAQAYVIANRMMNSAGGVKLRGSVRNIIALNTMEGIGDHAILLEYFAFRNLIEGNNIKGMAAGKSCVRLERDPTAPYITSENRIVNNFLEGGEGAYCADLATDNVINNVISDNDLLPSAGQPAINDYTGRNVKICNQVNGVLEEQFREIGLSVTVGTGNVYAEPTPYLIPFGRLRWFIVKFAIGGTFVAGETLTYAIKAYYSDGTEKIIERITSSTGDIWVKDESLFWLFEPGKAIWKLEFLAKSDQTTTAVTVTVDIVGT